MTNYKSDKIREVVHGSVDKPNLHEIKERTGAGNGFKNDIEAAEEVSSYDTNYTHKSSKIHEVVHENDRKLNLHEIKAKTGAGSGHKHTPTSCPKSESSINDVFVNTHKSHNIYNVVTSIEGKANLHKIKAQTGAGNGYKHPTPSSSNTSYEASCQNTQDSTHKSHRIHAVFHAHDRKLNLHEIKAKTGAGSGHKH
mgnify:CR=1 FL=1